MAARTKDDFGCGRVHPPFLLHVLPTRLVRIRHYGWMASRHRRQCADLCRALLVPEPLEPAATDDAPVRRCPHCGGAIEIVEVMLSRELLRRRLSRSLYQTPHSAMPFLTNHAGRSARTLEAWWRGDLDPLSRRTALLHYQIEPSFRGRVILLVV